MSLQFGPIKPKKMDFEKVHKIINRFETKISGTFVENWVKYWKNLFIDYKEVVLDVKNGVKTKPLKAFALLTAAAYLTYCNKNNPDYISFRDAVAKANTEIIQVNSSLVNKTTVQHLKLLEKCYNAHLLRRLNLGICSVMWIDNHSDCCHTYECTCAYLGLTYKTFFKRIIDIGFVNKWWVLDKHMQNFDVDY